MHIISFVYKVHSTPSIDAVSKLIGKQICTIKEIIIEMDFIKKQCYLFVTDFSTLNTIY